MNNKFLVNVMIFKPVKNLAPRHLTAEQIESYNRQGFVAPLKLFDGEDARLQQLVDMRLETISKDYVKREEHEKLVAASVQAARNEEEKSAPLLRCDVREEM